MASKHTSVTTTFGQRASTASHPLSSYLLRLMELKQSNLCVSADVTTTRELFNLIEQVGPAIVVLKTHYDLLEGWDYTRTGAQLAALARKYGFLIFEDRKFCDIGSTVQKQYTSGTARIVEWAHITNANMSAGEDMVKAMAEAASKWRERVGYEVSTHVTVGTPMSETYYEDDADEEEGEGDAEAAGTPKADTAGSSPRQSTTKKSPPCSMRTSPLPRDREARKSSIVSVTTVTQSYEPIVSPRMTKSMLDGRREHDVVFPGIEEAPLDRGLLLLAQMSSKGNLMNAEYTKACVDAARRHKDFVMGYVAQENLNSERDDTFLTMTPGCQLPPPGEEEHGGPIKGDGLGQQYNTPAKLVGLLGTDIIIVGRGIIQACDPKSEADRYRRRAWKAYEDRLQGV